MNSPIFALPKNGLDLVAQLVEHNTFNVGVLGSNPNGITERKETALILLSFRAFFILRVNNG